MADTFRVDLFARGVLMIRFLLATFLLIGTCATASVTQPVEDVDTANVVLCTPQSSVDLKDDGRLAVSKPGGIYEKTY